MMSGRTIRHLLIYLCVFFALWACLDTLTSKDESWSFVGAKIWGTMQSEQRSRWVSRGSQLFLVDDMDTHDSQTSPLILPRVPLSIYLSPGTLSNGPNAVLPFLLSDLLWSGSLASDIKIVAHEPFISTIHSQLAEFLNIYIHNNNLNQNRFSSSSIHHIPIIPSSSESQSERSNEGVILDLGQLMFRRNPNANHTKSLEVHTSVGDFVLTLELAENTIFLPNLFSKDFTSTIPSSSFKSQKLVDSTIFSWLGHLPIFDAAFRAQRSQLRCVDTRDFAAHLAQTVQLLTSSRRFGRKTVRLDLPTFDFDQLLSALADLIPSDSPISNFETHSKNSLNRQETNSMVQETMKWFSFDFSLKESLRDHLVYLFQRQRNHLSTKSHCDDSPNSTPSSQDVETLHDAFSNMSNGTFQLITADAKGRFWSINCARNMDTKTAEIVMDPAIQYVQGASSVYGTFRKLGQSLQLQFGCDVNWSTTKMNEQLVLNEKGVEGNWFQVEMVDFKEKSFRLSTTDSGGQKSELAWAHKNHNDNALTFVDSSQAKGVTLRFNPICLEGPLRQGDWNVIADDPITISSVHHTSLDGRNLNILTANAQNCFESQLQMADMSHSMSLLHNSQSYPPKLHSKTVSLNLQSEYGNWAAKEKHYCSVDCSAPIPCLASKRCRCVQYSCADTTVLLRSPDVKTLSLAERIDRVSWDDVIFPEARPSFDLDLKSLSTIHVIPVDRSIDKHWEDPHCYSQETRGWAILADHLMIQSLLNAQNANILPVPSVPEADYFFLPFYEGCYFNYLPVSLHQNLADSLKFYENYLKTHGSFKGGSNIFNRLVIPFSHDFGQCAQRTGLIEQTKNWKRPIPMNEAISWQPNGELNTACFKPGRDIVIPGAGGSIPAFQDAFGNLTNVKPFEERGFLAFFRGGVRGFGSIARSRVACASKGHADIHLQTPGNYAAIVNDSKFCLLPRGVQAWTTRTYEVLYGGCIPVFIADLNLAPFHDIVDWSKFSVTIPENQVDNYVEILRAIPIEQAQKLQATLLKVRDFFTFQGEHDLENGHKGPTYMTLVSLHKRRGLQWPT